MARGPLPVFFFPSAPGRLPGFSAGLSCFSAPFSVGYLC